MQSAPNFLKKLLADKLTIQNNDACPTNCIYTTSFSDLVRSRTKLAVCYFAYLAPKQSANLLRFKFFQKTGMLITVFSHSNIEYFDSHYTLFIGEFNK